jgi:hypothetical protein
MAPDPASGGLPGRYSTRQSRLAPDELAALQKSAAAVKELVDVMVPKLPPR